MTAYYNEIDPYAAQWLRNLIAAGRIAPGDVDERSIEDVFPDDLRGYAQCHFFAGIGVWSYALRLAGWPDDRPVWTGSCPCQPFSSAGSGAGFADERHLWPAFFHLIAQRRPAVVFGEQVASKDAEPWIDLVRLDLEAVAYRFGVVPFPAAGLGAPHIRDRLYWVAHAQGPRRAARRIAGAPGRPTVELVGHGAARGMADAANVRRAQPGDAGELHGAHAAESEHGAQDSTIGSSGVLSTGGLAHADARGREWPGLPIRPARQDETAVVELGGDQGHLRAGPTHGFWRDADWLFCRDGKWRPVEPGTFPLVNGDPNRVGRLRAYGNAIVAPQAAEWIAAFMNYELQDHP